MNSKLRLALSGAIGVLTLPMAAQAQWWNQHPGYLHALADLRTAYWLIQHRGGNEPVQAEDENKAQAEIRAAYQELVQASISDGKDIDNQPPPGFVWGDHGSRLHKVDELLHKARDEILGEEENPAARGLRSRADGHIGRAMHWNTSAIHYWHF